MGQNFTKKFINISITIIVITMSSISICLTVGVCMGDVCVIGVVFSSCIVS